MYFSCLEALQNVAKYARATKATVRLSQANGSLTFEVIDDGVGFDPVTASRGSGLQGIADRLAALGGSVEDRSAPAARYDGGGPHPRHGDEPMNQRRLAWTIWGISVAFLIAS